MQVKEIRGVRIPEIGLGTHKLYGNECNRTVRTALDLGYRHIDTAQMYQNEKEIGDAIHESKLDRGELFLTTKIWHTSLEHDDILLTVENTLAQMNTPWIDLLLIHWPNPHVSLERSFEAMMLLRDQGKVLNLGVSNFTMPLTRYVLEDLGIPLFCNQLEFHPFLSQFDMLDYSYEKEFLLTAYSPLAQGRVMQSETLQKIGQAYGKTAAQVALRWLIEQEHVIAIPKASSREHLQSNIELYDFELTDEHFQEIDDLEKNVRLVNPVFAPEWD